ncbi:uncharacterized protein LOC144661434 [Oculina patagonica]
MFEKCHKCGQGGLTCQDDYASLKSGHWWEWRNKTYKDRYRDFIANLLTSSPALDASSIQFPYPIPTPYKCPTEESCKGGLDSPCEEGYEGPICSVCSPGYYKQLQTCKKCSSKKWIVAQLSITAIVVLIIAVLLVWSSKRKVKKTRRRPLIDVFLSKLKIVIGFYQVTYGLLQTFSYIKWPGSLQVVAKYSEILQMDVFHIAPVHCLFPTLHVDAFGSLFAIMTLNASVIGVSVLAYGIRKIIIVRSGSLEEEKSRNISEAKELVYRNLFFVLYVTYLSTCSKTANVLPLACRKLCRDEKEKLCYKYMKADYSIRCHGARYNYLLIGAYVSVAYVVVLPVMSFITIWEKQRQATTDAQKHREPGYSKEVITGLRFLFENYKLRSWYWELVELSRKVILTSGLILVGEESRSYIGLAWVVAGMYGMLFSWIKPIQDLTDNRLMTMSLAVTVVNLGIGAVSRIPAEKITSTSIDPYTDAVLFKILILGANTLVIGLLVGQYAAFVYRYLKEWRKNPQWSLSCCLALLLPLSDSHGEISDLMETNVLANELQTGKIDMPTISTAVNEGKAVDFSLEKGEQDHGNETRVAQDDNCQHMKNHNLKCHQRTQTELFALLSVDLVCNKPMEEKLK